jgi:hypothetical protein
MQINFQNTGPEKIRGVWGARFHFHRRLRQPKADCRRSEQLSRVRSPAAQTRLAYLFEPTNGVPWDARVFRTRVAKSSLRAASAGIFFSQGRCGEPCFRDSSCDRTEQFSTTLGPLLPPYAGCVRASRDPRSANGGRVGSLTCRMVVSCGLLPVSNLSQSTKSYGGTTVSRKKATRRREAPTAADASSAGEYYFYSLAIR